MATATKKTQTPTVTVTVSKFDTQSPYAAIRNAVPIADWQPIVRRDYNPRGGTPLRDATAKFIAHLAEQTSPGKVTIGLLADESGSMGGNEESVVAGINEFVQGMADTEIDPETDGKVLAVILTDGYENSSHEVSADDLRQMVDAREQEGWTFIYLGANQDAWNVAEGAGMRESKSSSYLYTSSPVGTASAMGAASLDASEWLGSNSQRETTKAGRLEGITKDTIGESGQVISRQEQQAVAKAAQAREQHQSEAPSEGSSYNVEDALKKAKGES